MGDVEALYSVFVEDPHVLERMDGVAFADTPLLVAAGCRCWEHPFCDGNGKLKALAGLEAKSSLAQPHARGFVGGIAIDVLFGWLRLSNKEQILKWKDDDGNTALHMRNSRVHWKYHINRAISK
ncbi:hypothetical protein CISIN_1g046364mg [Citrus sinensis]|uniref:Uncharacterized protein n=1 Tax=Citrus sinensis TaxID=2711 RepID=A0A067D4C1_CITSI|nr:hypothetical protein CISIN_1g046364mg [Citrus sinensis]